MYHLLWSGNILMHCTAVKKKGQLVKSSLGPKSQVPDREFQVPDPESQIQNTESQVLNTKYKILKKKTFGQKMILG